MAKAYRLVSVAWAWLALAAGAVAGQVSELAPADAPARGEMAAASEPGTRMEVSGRVLDARTSEPVAGASVYLYQTDARGYYTPNDVMGNRDPRLRLHLRTAADGTFRASTIRPGPYPGGGPPAHIHVVIIAEGYERRESEFVFEGDPALNAQIRRMATRPAAPFIVTTPRRTEAGEEVSADIRLYARGGS